MNQNQNCDEIAEQKDIVKIKKFILKEEIAFLFSFVFVLFIYLFLFGRGVNYQLVS